MKNIFTTLLVFLSISFFAQSPFDCSTAYNVCGGESFNLSFDNPKGKEDEAFMAPCFDEEIVPTNFNKNTIWLKYQFKNEGNFDFTIHSENNYDFDFLVLKSTDKTCSSLSTVRCMASGKGNKDGCIGDTGLREESTDQSEGPGCSGDDDNFLATIPVKAGDIYFVVINCFSNDVFDFSIIHKNKDIIGCATTQTADLAQNTISITPNPAINQINLSSDLQKKNTHFEMINLLGISFLNGDFKGNRTLDVSNLPAGTYFMRFSSDGVNFGVKKILIVE